MERTKEIVLDASVMVKWFSEEDDTDKALKIRNNHIEGSTTVVSPDLTLYEVANALRYNPGFNVNDVGRAVADLMDLQIDLITPNRELLENSAKISYEYGLSIYDAYYLSLAKMMGLILLTADSQFYRKARGSSLIRLLKDYPL